MTERYFRDIRRRVEQLERTHLPPVFRELVWFDEDGTITMIAGPNGVWELDEGDDESEDNRDTFYDEPPGGPDPIDKPVVTG